MPLIYGTIFTPSTQSISYRGLPSSIEPGFYGMIVETETGSALIGTAKRPIPMSVVVNENSEIPPLVLALMDARACHVIIDGRAPNLAGFRDDDPADGGYLCRRQVRRLREGARPRLARRDGSAGRIRS